MENKTEENLESLSDSMLSYARELLGKSLFLIENEHSFEKKAEIIEEIRMFLGNQKDSVFYGIDKGLIHLAVKHGLVMLNASRSSVCDGAKISMSIFDRILDDRGVSVESVKNVFDFLERSGVVFRFSKKEVSLSLIKSVNGETLINKNKIILG